uniref:Uncharacterized protein n=1 Tax=Anguilla anguilla TaxID=7936 RepID=A0A0E9PX49_ANGAN
MDMELQATRGPLDIRSNWLALAVSCLGGSRLSCHFGEAISPLPKCLEAL